MAILSAVLAFHFLLATGLQLYFFRYANSVAIVPEGSGGSSPGHILTRDTSPVDKVTELQPLNLIRDFEGNASIAITDAKAEAAEKLSDFATSSIHKENRSKAAAISIKESVSKDGNSITKSSLTEESTTVD